MRVWAHHSEQHRNTYLIETQQGSERAFLATRACARALLALSNEQFLLIPIQNFIPDGLIKFQQKPLQISQLNTSSAKPFITTIPQSAEASQVVTMYASRTPAKNKQKHVSTVHTAETFRCFRTIFVLKAKRALKPTTQEPKFFS